MACSCSKYAIPRPPPLLRQHSFSAMEPKSMSPRFMAFLRPAFCKPAMIWPLCSLTLALFRPPWEVTKAISLSTTWWWLPPWLPSFSYLLHFGCRFFHFGGRPFQATAASSCTLLWSSQASNWAGDSRGCWGRALDAHHRLGFSGMLCKVIGGVAGSWLSVSMVWAFSRPLPALLLCALGAGVGLAGLGGGMGAAALGLAFFVPNTCCKSFTQVVAFILATFSTIFEPC